MHRRRKTIQQQPSVDFCQIFREDMSGLYQLSFLLTANHEKAEQCFVASLEDSLAGPSVFKDWARSWARRRIIQNALRVIKPQPSGENGDTPAAPADINGTAHPASAELFAILDLRPFERFVFVMSVLERYTDQDCAILLGCGRRDVIAARSRALQQIASSTTFHRNERADAGTESPALNENHTSIVELKVAPWLATSA